MWCLVTNVSSDLGAEVESIQLQTIKLTNTVNAHSNQWSSNAHSSSNQSKLRLDDCGVRLIALMTRGWRWVSEMVEVSADSPRGGVALWSRDLNIMGLIPITDNLACDIWQGTFWLPPLKETYNRDSLCLCAWANSGELLYKQCLWHFLIAINQTAIKKK
jgi:hypothetical protein